MLDDATPLRPSSLNPQPATPSINQRQNSDNLEPQQAHAHALCRLGLSEYTLAELEALPARIERWSNALRPLSVDSDIQTLYAGHATPSVQQLQWLASFHDKRTPEPEGFGLFAYDLHTSTRVNRIFRKARKKAYTYQKRLQALGQYIDLNELPDAVTTVSYIDKVSGKVRSLPFSAAKRKAVAALRTSLRPGYKLDDPRVRQNLTDIRALLADVIAFSERPSVCKMLGPAFKGIDTDWHQLKAYIRFSQAIRYAAASREHALQLIEQWSEQRKGFLNASGKIAPLRRSLAQLERLHTLGSTGQQQANASLEAVLAHAQDTAPLIQQHLAALVPDIPDDTLTLRHIAGAGTA